MEFLNLFSLNGWMVIIIWLFMFGFVSGARSDPFGAQRIIAFVLAIGVFIATQMYMTGQSMEKNLGTSVVTDLQFANEMLISSGVAGVCMFVFYIIGVARSG